MWVTTLPRLIVRKYMGMYNRASTPSWEVSMRRPLCAILAALALVINLAGAHESRHQSSEPTDPSIAASRSMLVNLLQESHDLTQQLPVSTRIKLLTRQAQMVSRLRADLAQEWAHELFTLSFQAREDLRAFVQNNAMAILVRLDPVYGELLFRQATWHATLLHPFRYVIDFKRALNFGEAQPGSWRLPRADRADVRPFVRA
jgi:hypothetical protein